MPGRRPLTSLTPSALDKKRESAYPGLLHGSGGALTDWTSVGVMLNSSLGESNCGSDPAQTSGTGLCSSNDGLLPE